MERRDDVRQPIRLRVTFKSPRALIAEYTTSVSKGGCAIRSPSAVPVGTLFIFELSTEGASRKSLEIEGRVVHSTPRTDGGFDVGISYVSVSTPRRVAMTRFLDAVFSEQLANRVHARVPVNLIAQDVYEPELRYLVKDLSRGGIGLRLASERKLPPGLSIGQKAEVTVRHDGEVPFVLPADVVRLVEAEPGKRQASIGLRFIDISEANQRLVDALLYLHRPEAILIRFLGH